MLIPTSYLRVPPLSPLVPIWSIQIIIEPNHRHRLSNFEMVCQKLFRTPSSPTEPSLLECHLSEVSLQKKPCNPSTIKPGWRIFLTYSVFVPWKREKGLSVSLLFKITYSLRPSFWEAQEPPGSWFGKEVLRDHRKGATLAGQGSERNQAGASQPDLRECHILQNANFPSTFVLTEGGKNWAFIFLCQ